jgi:hypothetical protein
MDDTLMQRFAEAADTSPSTYGNAASIRRRVGATRRRKRIGALAAAAALAAAVPMSSSLGLAEVVREAGTELGFVSDPHRVIGPAFDTKRLAGGDIHLAPPTASPNVDRDAARAAAQRWTSKDLNDSRTVSSGLFDVTTSSGQPRSRPATNLMWVFAYEGGKPWGFGELDGSQRDEQIGANAVVVIVVNAMTGRTLFAAEL